jgi:hypothetical protein
LELIFWLLIGLGIIIIISYAWRWLDSLPTASLKSSSYTVIPKVLVNPFQSIHLPANLAEEAWILWQMGKKINALSLLYRGAIAVLVSRDGLIIDDSATERECLRQVEAKQAVELTSYFSKLTLTWQKLAYSGLQPNEAEMQQLCEQWEQIFG